MLVQRWWWIGVQGARILISLKQDTLNQGWIMLDQRRSRWANIKPILVQPVVFTGLEPVNKNKVHSPNAVSMLGQRRRRWANIETPLGECLVFAAGEQKHRKATCVSIYKIYFIK